MPVETTNGNTSAEILAECPRKHRRTCCRSVLRSARQSRQSLTPVENSAFNELARQLSARLDTDNGQDDRDGDALPSPGSIETVVEKPSSGGAVCRSYRRTARERQRRNGWRRPSRRPAAIARRDKALLDLIAHRHPDLSSRPAAVCQSRLPQAASAMTAFTRWKKPADWTRSMSSREFRPPAATSDSRHAGDDFRKPRDIGRFDIGRCDIGRLAARDDRRAALHDFMGR